MNIIYSYYLSQLDSIHPLHYLDILHTNKKTLHNLNCEASENIDIKKLTF